MAITHMTLDQLFDVIEENRETQADVTMIKIIAEDMVRFNNEFLFEVEVFTHNHVYSERDWQKALINTMSLESMASAKTSTTELRTLFDDEMWEFLQEYQPTIKFNNKHLSLATILRKDVKLPFRENHDS